MRRKAHLMRQVLTPGDDVHQISDRVHIDSRQTEKNLGDFAEQLVGKILVRNQVHQEHVGPAQKAPHFEQADGGRRAGNQRIVGVLPVMESFLAQSGSLAGTYGSGHG